MATSPVSLAQFGQNIKAKHPEYSDMADEDVASRVLKKYPQYQDMVLPAGASGPLPSVPKASVPQGLQGPPAQTGPAPSAGTFADTVSNIGTHLKNMVMGPVHAALDGSPGTPTGAAAQFLSRAFVEPTVQGGITAVEQAKKGNYGFKNEPEYDSQGNYTPTMLSGISDAIPVAGPWARNIETDAQQKGMVPALAGLGTDVIAPKVLSKFGGLALKAAGKTAQVASTSVPRVKLAATRFLVPGKPGELLQSALKPGVKYGAGVADTLQQSLPDVLNADPTLNGVSGFARASDAARDQSFQPYNRIMAKYRPAPGGIGPVMPQASETIYGGPIADAQNASIPAIDRFENPPTPPARNLAPSDWTARNPMQPPEPSGITARTAERANLYRRDIPVSAADALREDANAKLNAFYNKAGGDQNAALSSPETARVKAIGDATRQQLYPKLEADEGLPKGSVAAMQQKYGQISDVSDIANKREPVFARHDPVSLSQKIVAGHGNPLSMAWNYGVQRALGNLTNSDSLVNSAIDRFQHPAGTPLPARPGLFPMMGSALGRGLYGAGKATSALRLKFNPLLYSHAANPPK